MEDIDVASTSSGSTNDREISTNDRKSRPTIEKFSTNDREISRANIFRGRGIDERWSNLESFYEDHISAALSKIRCLDDEVWGKLILMNRNKCIAKMYLRNPLIVLDGSRNGFDSQRIGLDHFENADADEQTLEIRGKLGAGVLLKVDQKGSIWVKKVTKSLIVVQNIDKPGIASFGAEILKTNGILETNVPTKIFDMKLFKEDFERATRFKKNDDEITKRLLYKTILRISFVRNENRSLKTPCWCALINLIAMDLLTNLEDVKRIVHYSLSSSPNSSSDSFYGVPSIQPPSGDLSPTFMQVKNGAEFGVPPVGNNRQCQSACVDIVEDLDESCGPNWSLKNFRAEVQNHKTYESVSPSLRSTPSSLSPTTAGSLLVPDQEENEDPANIQNESIE